MLRPCLVHRANPRDTNLGLSSSNSLRKGELGIGDVVMEPLIDVWSDSRARINNTMDNSLEPLPASSCKLFTHQADSNPAMAMKWSTELWLLFLASTLKNKM